METKKSTTLEKFLREFCTYAQENYGNFTVLGEPITPREVTNPIGALPLLVERSLNVIKTLEFPDNWLCAEVHSDPSGMFQKRVDFKEDDPNLNYGQFFYLLKDAVMEAQRHSPNGSIELTTLANIDTLNWEKYHAGETVPSTEDIRPK
jgi:hypothetical protein